MRPAIVAERAPDRVELVLLRDAEDELAAVLRLVREFVKAQGKCLMEELWETRGEFVILVEGMTKMAEDANSENVDYAALVRELMEQGVAKKEAVRTVARRCGVPKRSVYQAALSL